MDLNARRAMRGPMRLLLFFSFATNLLLLAVPLHMLQIYDRVLSSASIETLIYLTAIVLLALAIYGVSEMVRGRLAQRLSSKYMIEHAEDVFDHLVYDTSGKHNPDKAIRDMNTVRSFLASKPFISLFDIPFAPVFVVLMFLLHITLGLLAVLGILLMVAIAWFNHRSTKTSRDQAQMAKSDATNFSLAVMRRTDDIRAMGLLPSIMNRWGRKTATSLNSADDANAYSSKFYGLSSFVRQALQVSAMAWGGYLVVTGDMSGGMIFAASMLLSRALMPVQQLIGSWEQAINARYAHNSIMVIVSDARARPDAMELPEPQGFVSVEELTFHPGEEEGRPPIIHDVSFELNPGEILAVLGPSGAGKSTIARLMVGAMQPTSGTVRLDKFDLEQWPSGQRGHAIGYVPQDIMLFPGTIAENIARLEVEPDEKRIVAAARMAGVHDMIAGLPDGYGTIIGPSTMTLSGGQRQRIALARAFYTSPKVLVLDEPNAHLDREGERLLMEALVRAKEKGVGILVVSQRRGILNIADRVMLVEAGKARMLERMSGDQANYFGVPGETPPKAAAAKPAANPQTANKPQSAEAAVGVSVAKAAPAAMPVPAAAGAVNAKFSQPIIASSAALRAAQSAQATQRQPVAPPPLVPETLSEIRAERKRELENELDAWMNDPLFDEFDMPERAGKHTGGVQ